MAHEFYIKTTSGEFVTYTDYDAIDLTTLKHVIKFLPELGTLVDSHEILLETGTLNASAADGVITEEDNSVTATDGTTYAVPAENKLLLEDNGQIMYENAALNPLGKLVPEQFTDGVALVDDISLASFVRVSDSVPDNDVRDVKFNNDGTKIFILGRANDNVYEYSVSTPFDVSTMSAVVRTLDISVVSSTQGDNAANGLEFNTDGTKMFILGQGQDLVNEYALSTGFDLSTASFTQSLDISDQEDLPYGVTFNNDGTKMYITGRRQDNVDEYVLTTGFDISTASHSQTFSVSDQAVRASAVRFNSDGTKMYVLEGGTDGVGHNTIYQYALTTAFDVSTASYSDKSLSVVDEENKARGFCFGDNDQQLYVCGWRGDDVNQYTATWPKRATSANAPRDVDGDGDVDVRSTDGLENHLVLETAPDSVVDDHYHLPVGHHHEAGDGHTEEEHRELALWNHKLALLMARERLNNS